MKKSCGIYEIENGKGSVSYKIFEDEEVLYLYLKKNRDKACKRMAPVFSIGEYQEYPKTEVRRLSAEEIERYMSER